MSKEGGPFSEVVVPKKVQSVCQQKTQEETGISKSPPHTHTHPWPPVWLTIAHGDGVLGVQHLLHILLKGQVHCSLKGVGQD